MMDLNLKREEAKKEMEREGVARMIAKRGRKEKILDDQNKEQYKDEAMKISRRS